MGLLGKIAGATLGFNVKPKTKEECRKEIGEIEAGLGWKHGLLTPGDEKARLKYLKGILKTY